MTKSFVFAFVLWMVVTPNAMGAKAVDAAGEDAPIAAKLVVDSAGEAEAAASAKIDGAALPAGAAAAPEAPAKAEVAKLPESQIPVLTAGKSAKKAEGGSLNRILITLGVLTAVLAGAVFGLKRWASRGGNKKPTNRIKILTQHPLGSKKSLAIIQVAGESILVGITDHNISMLKTLSLIDDEIPEDIPRNFDTALDDYEDEAGGRAARDEFAMTGLGEIRDKVSSRLKNMKSF